MQNLNCTDYSSEEAVGLLTTYRCNLRCKYCYIQEKKDLNITLEMAQSLLEPFLLKHAGLLSIIFMGGETLLAMDVICPLVEWVEANHWNRPYRFFGSTNGTLLTEDKKKWVTKHRDIITLGLSYDGIPEIQISNRGNDRIDIDYFLHTWPKQPIQMTINEESVKQMANGVIYLLEKGAMVHPNVAYEKKEWSKDSIIEYGKQLNYLIYYYSHHPEKPLVSQFIHNLCEYADNIVDHKEQREICSAGDGFQVFDIDGKSYPCHLLSPLVLKGNKLQEVCSGLITEKTIFADTKCRKCPYTTSCPTCIGCNFLYRDALNIRDNTHCDIMKTEVKAFIKMEVLRLKAKNTITSEDASEIDAIIKLLSV